MNRRLFKGSALNEHDFNTALAAELERCKTGWRGKISAERERVLDRGRADILVFPDGIEPVAVECAYEGTSNVDGDAIKRFNNEIKHFGRAILTAIAVKIPAQVRKLPNAAAVKKWLKNDNQLEYAAYFLNIDPRQKEIWDDGEQWGRFPEGAANQGYLSGTVRDLADLIELAATPQPVIAGVVKQAVQAVYGAVNVMETLLSQSAQESIAKAVGQPAGAHAMRVAACVWLNAMILQGRLAEADVKVNEGRAVKPAWGLQGRNSHDNLVTEWDLILEIDYRSVFRPASISWKAMDDINPAIALEVFNILSKAAKQVCTLRLEVTGDIAAEMFPLLAADRKETAAFYTKPEAAELLASIALRMLHHPPSKDGIYKIADFACGTGTLLKSAYRAARRKAEMNNDPAARKPDLFHRLYMEKGIYGADIQHIASHLAVSGLAGMRPSSYFEFSNIVCPPVTEGRTGSLELLDSKNPRLSNLLETIEGADGGKTEFIAKDNSFDLCIMNPPYTRAHGRHKKNPDTHEDKGGIFAIDGLSQADRKESAKRLKILGRNSKIYNGTAGMSNAFAGLADKKLKGGGVFAFVLPLSAANANTWIKFREHMMTGYDEVIVMSAPKSFSADTFSGEILVCARKRESGKEKSNERKFSVINLKRTPKSLMEAREMAKILSEHKTTESVSLGNENIASWLQTKESDLSIWGYLGVNNLDVAKIALSLKHGEFYGKKSRISFRPLKDLPIAMSVDFCSIGHVVGSDTRGAFAFTPAREGKEFLDASVWHAITKKQKRLIISPTHKGSVFPGREDIAKRVRTMKTRLFISRDLSLASQALAACSTATPMLGGRAWCGLQCEALAEKAYCLYLNSIFGLMLRWHYGNILQAGRVRMNLGDLRNFPMPDFAAKTPAAKRAREIANKRFPNIAGQDMLPCCFAWNDDVRKKIDAVVMDMLGLDIPPDEMQRIRRLWCSEMSVHGGKKSAMAALANPTDDSTS